jgi:hypothetical protein
MFIGIITIFLQAIKTKSGESWLEWFWRFMSTHWSSKAVASVILLVVIIGFMFYITKGEKKPKSSKKEKKED